MNQIRHSKSNSPDSDWPRPPDNWQLRSQTVDIFAIDLSSPPIRFQYAKQNLTEIEQQRVDRFKSLTRQREFTITRALLRMLLASILRVNPLSLNFDHSPQGKPGLADQPVHFNVTHSHELSLIAVSPDLPLGIDIEHITPRDGMMKLARRFFAPAEFEAINRLPETMQQQAFHTTWTRKEAFVKATAKGIALGLDRFEVCVDPTRPAQLLKHPSDLPQHWHLHNLPPIRDYCTCLCTPLPDPNLRCWQFG